MPSTRRTIAVLSPFECSVLVAINIGLSLSHLNAMHCEARRLLTLASFRVQTGLLTFTGSPRCGPESAEGVNRRLGT
jgi:hypothetical protein